MIYVAAGGHGTRMAHSFEAQGITPRVKHTLETGNLNDPSETLVRRSAVDALMAGAAVTVIVNTDNSSQISDTLNGLPVDIVTETEPSPLGPFRFAREHGQAAETTTYSVAGDTYIESPDWASFIHTHEDSRKPVSFLVGRTAIQPTNAVFELDSDGELIRFYRAEIPEDTGAKNVGMYAITLTEPVIEILDAHRHSAEDQGDVIANSFISEGLAGAVIYNGIFFNINTLDDYNDLLRHTAQTAPTLH